MCGLAAIMSFDSSEVDRNQLNRMTSIMHHRGPDSVGYWQYQNIAFGFQRLSIQDLSKASDQPMTSTDGRFTIVFNGEIYNFIEIRDRLRNLGYEFRSSGDTEVLLNAFAEWGWDCLPMLNGMWTFLIYDRIKRTLHGSRDRFGIKPLFYCRMKSQLMFGSEIKSIRASTSRDDGVDWGVAARFLIHQTLDFDESSFFSGIEKIAPGTAFEVDTNGKMRSWSYWEIPTGHKDKGQDPCEEYAEIFADSVRLRLRSDVPLGVFLSGGLDSTSIICEMARMRDASSSSQQINAFSFIHKEYDESEFINDTIAQVKANLKRTTTDSRHLWSSLAKMLWYQDEPVHSMTALVGFELAKVTAESGIKVILNGQGADETAAGYPSYFQNYWHSLITTLNAKKAWTEIGKYVSAFGGSQRTLYLDTIKSLMRAQLRHLKVYRRMSGLRRMKDGLSDEWFTGDFRNFLTFEEAAYLDLSLDRQFRDSVTVSPLPLYLRIEDRNTMAHGLEARLPFLDFRLVSFLFSIDDHWKMRGPWNKYILRRSMRNHIPESVRIRKEKMGFPTPVKSWFAGPLFEFARELLSDSRTKQRGVLRVDKILADLEAHRAGYVDIGAELFNVLQFELWMRTVVDNGLPFRAP